MTLYGEVNLIILDMRLLSIEVLSLFSGACIWIVILTQTPGTLVTGLIDLYHISLKYFINPFCFQQLLWK